VRWHPDIFSLNDDGLAEVIDSARLSVEAVRDAAKNCPTQAISFDAP
jgi:ferredoxin